MVILRPEDSQTLQNWKSGLNEYKDVETPITLPHSIWPTNHTLDVT